MKKLYILFGFLIFLTGCVREGKEAKVEKIPEVQFPAEEEIKETPISEEKKPSEAIEKPLEEKKEEVKEGKVEEEKKVVLLPKKEPVSPPPPKEKTVEIPTPKPFIDVWNEECLIYDLKWASMNLGKAIFLCAEEKNYYRIVGVTIPDGLPAHFGYGYNRTDSFIDKKTGKPGYSYLYSKTGKTENITEIFFNWSANQYTIIEKKLKDKKVISFKKNVVKFEGDIYDCLSAFYLMRNPDSENFKNSEIPLALAEIWYLKINLKGKEYKNFSGGERREVFIVEPFLRSSKKTTKNEKLNVWITTDNKKLPVLFEGSMPFGKATMILRETRKIDLKLQSDVNKIIEDIILSISS